MLASGDLVYCKAGQMSRRTSNFAQPILLLNGVDSGNTEGYYSSDQEILDYDHSLDLGSEKLCNVESDLLGESEFSRLQSDPVRFGS